MMRTARSIFTILFAAALIGLLALPARAAPQAVPTSPGVTGLVAWWSMNELSGIRYDSHGTNHLTDVNTVASVAGVVGNASYAMYANGEYLTVADNAALSMGDIDFTMCGWIQLLNQKNEAEILYKWQNTPTTVQEYLLKYQATADRFQFGVSPNDTSTASLAVANTLGSPALNVWYFVCGWHDALANTINIQVNNGGVDSVSYSLGVNSSSAPVLLSRPKLATVNMYQDETFIYKRVLSADERSWLYNSGAGQSYANLISPPTAGANVMAVDDAYTVALLHMNGADASTTFTDESGKTWTAAGNAQIDTAQSVFGGASGLFDGTGDWIDTPHSSDFNIGSENFTIDLRLKKAEDGRLQYFLGKAASSPTPDKFTFYFSIDATNKLYSTLAYGNGVNDYLVLASSGTITISTGWAHLAFIRNGNTLTQYINGVADGTLDVTGKTFNSVPYKLALGRLGEYSDPSRLFNGWIDEFRFSKGIARWTSNFTPPTAPNMPPPTATNTPLPTATNTPLPTATNTPLHTETATDTPLPSDTPTATDTFTPTAGPTFTPSNTPTITSTPGNLATAFWQNAISYGEAAQVSATALLCLVVTLGLLAWLVVTTLQKRRK